MKDWLTVEHFSFETLAKERKPTERLVKRLTTVFSKSVANETVI
jgi:hypothetical protein